jgi:hypothetical protein
MYSRSVEIILSAGNHKMEEVVVKDFWQDRLHYQHQADVEETYAA